MTLRLPYEQAAVLLMVAEGGSLSLPALESTANDIARRQADALEALSRTGLVRRVAHAGSPHQSYVLSGAGIVAARRLRVEPLRILDRP